MLTAVTCTPLGGGRNHNVGSERMKDSESPALARSPWAARSITKNGLGLWGVDDALSECGFVGIVLRWGVTWIELGVGSKAAGFCAPAVGEGAATMPSTKSFHKSKSSSALSSLENKPFSKDNKLVGSDVLSPAADSC